MQTYIAKIWYTGVWYMYTTYNTFKNWVVQPNITESKHQCIYIQVFRTSKSRLIYRLQGSNRVIKAKACIKLCTHVNSAKAIWCPPAKVNLQLRSNNKTGIYWLSCLCTTQLTWSKRNVRYKSERGLIGTNFGWNNAGNTFN